jgi:mono/diheme cytochrome c family protein
MRSKLRFTVVLLTVLGIAAGSPAIAQQKPPAEKGPALDMKQVTRGRYLSRIAGCNDCHTEGYLVSEGKVPEAQWLTGASLGWRGPWGTTYGANLRLFVNALTEEQWLTTARQLKARPPMPWFTLNTMDETDLRALYQFIRYLGPAGKPAPAYVPPGQEPTTPYALFPSPPPTPAK